MINAALTTQIGKTGFHSKIWAKWTERLIKYLSDNHNYLVFMLWGKNAQKHISNIDEKRHYVLEWLHPSPMAQGVPEHMMFKNCDHFKFASEICEDDHEITFDWNPTQSTMVYTDGACKNNGRPNAKGGYGVYFQKGPLAGMKIHAPLAESKHNGHTMKPTNNRGELLAAIDALETYHEHGCVGNLYLVVDSKLTMDTITCWLDNWYRNGKIDQMKNPDLLWRLKSILDKVRKWQEKLEMKFELIHVRSHLTKKNIPKKGTKQYKLWLGNEVADKLANDGVEAQTRTVTQQ